MSGNHHTPVIRSVNGRSVDVADADAVAQLLGELDSHAKSLAAKVESGEKTRAQQDVEVKRLAEELRTVRQRQAEDDAARAQRPGTAADSELVSRFVDHDGRLFLRGANHEDGGKADPGLMRATQTGLMTTKPLSESHGNLQKASEALYVAATLFKGDDAFNRDGTYRESVVRTLPQFAGVQAAWKAMPAAMHKAWDSQNGTGGEFIPLPLLSSPVWQVEEYDPDGILGLFETTELDSSSVELPLGTSYPVPYKGGGASGNNPAALAKSSVGTDKMTLSVTPMYVLIPVHEDAAADSITAAAPFLSSAMAMSMSVAERLIIMNGNPDGDTDTLSTWDLRDYFGAIDAGSIDYRRIAKGLRTIALDGSNDVDRSTFSLSLLMTDLNSVGGVRGAPEDMPVITSYEGWFKNFATLDNLIDASKYGSDMVIARGERGRINGFPVLATDAMPADLASTGKYTGSGTTTGAVIPNRRMFRRLSRAGEGLQLLTQRDITTGLVYLRVRRRIGFANLNPGTDAGVRYLRNMAI